MARRDQPCAYIWGTGFPSTEDNVEKGSDRTRVPRWDYLDVFVVHMENQCG